MCKTWLSGGQPLPSAAPLRSSAAASGCVMGPLRCSSEHDILEHVPETSISKGFFCLLMKSFSLSFLLALRVPNYVFIINVTYLSFLLAVTMAVLGLFYQLKKMSNSQLSASFPL